MRMLTRRVDEQVVACGVVIPDRDPERRVVLASTMVCIPTSLSQEVGAALAAQAGETRLREVIAAGGFRSVRRAIETPFNMILEARP